MNVFTTKNKYRREIKIILAFLGLCLAVTLLVTNHSVRKTSNATLMHGIEAGDTVIIQRQDGCTAAAKVIASHQQQIKVGLTEPVSCK
jgi:hypothetical protein